MAVYLRKFACLAVLICIASRFFGCAEADAEVVLVRDGKCNCTIIIGTDATDTERYAAEELRTHLSQISDCNIPLETGVVVDTPMILVGPSKALTKVASDLDLKAMGKEELIIRTKGRHLILAGGRPRGTLYAVVEFLEKYLGCRWYTKDISYIPKQSTIRLDKIEYRYNPTFMYREVLYKEAHYTAFAARQRLNGGYNRQVRRELPGGAVAIEPFAHTFPNLVPANVYFKEHPEYFSLVKGNRMADKQLCLSNPEVLKIATKQVLKWDSGMPKGVIISVSQNDGYGACECEKCQAIVKEEGTEMGPILRFVNGIADEVAKQNPDRYIETLSYAYSETPTKLTKPRDNVIIRLCHWHPGCNLHGIATCPTNKVYRNEIEGWKKLAKNIFIWDYMVTFHELLAPFPNWWAIGADCRYYAEQGINGVFWQGNHMGPGSEMSDLRTYIAAQMLWHPYQDVNVVINDFLDGVYGPAAKPIREYLEMLHEYVVKENICRNRTPLKLSPEMLSRARSLFDEAEKLAPSEDMRNRVKKARASIQYVQLCDPKKYGLDKNGAFDLLKAFKETVAREKITNFKESRTELMGDWLRQRERKLKEIYQD